MNKSLLIVMLLGTIILAGCSQQGPSEQDLFAKKQECAGYYDEIKEEAKNNITSSHRIKEIFYSPVLKSCLYQVEISYPDSELKDYDIHDYLVKKLIFTTGNIIKFEDKIKELKGE